MDSIEINLIPDIMNPTPDYYCTWQTQLYATCDGKPVKQRECIGEKQLFGEKGEKPYGWAQFYEEARKDLLLVMDDSWDVPLSGDGSYYGSLILNEEKFPESVRAAREKCGSENKNTENIGDRKSENAYALGALVDRVKALGWKGLGGWVCAQESEKFRKDCSVEEYWKKRMKEAEESGFSYWKVDWGEKAGDVFFRKWMTELGKAAAPNLLIEHAMKKELIPVSDAFRTYDVPAIMSIPMTMRKLADIFLTIEKEKVISGSLSEDENTSKCMGLINCEDEAYISAAGGFSMGIMRHPYCGAFVNGKADMSFPAVHRNLKTKMYEVVRAARWHRIAPAFHACVGITIVSEKALCDTWHFENTEEEIERWWLDMPLFKEDLEGNLVKKYAPFQIARNCEMAEAKPDENGKLPYIISSKNPNGVFSIVTLGRTKERTYEIPRCKITVDVEEAETIGIFGEYETLTVKGAACSLKKVLMQDLAGDTAFDVTKEVRFEGNMCVIPGDLIHRIGTLAQPEGDTSEPGVAVRFC